MPEPILYEELRAKLDESLVPVNERDLAISFVRTVVDTHGLLLDVGLDVFGTIHAYVFPERQVLLLTMAETERFFTQLLREDSATLRPLREHEGQKVLRFLFISPKGATCLVVQPIPKTAAPVRVNCRTTGEA